MILIYLKSFAHENKMIKIKEVDSFKRIVPKMNVIFILGKNLHLSAEQSWISSPSMDCLGLFMAW